MRPVTKTVLNVMLRRARRDRDEEKIGLLEAVLEDDHILDLVHEALNADFEYSTAGTKQAFGNPIQNFLKWLTDHREEVLAAVKLILTLLAVL
jgi:hypothetical protein